MTDIKLHKPEDDSTDPADIVGQAFRDINNAKTKEEVTSINTDFQTAIDELKVGIENKTEALTNDHLKHLVTDFNKAVKARMNHVVAQEAMSQDYENNRFDENGNERIQSEDRKAA